MKLESAAPAMGLRIDQLSLAKEGNRAVDELRALLLEHQLLVITKQQLTSEQLMDFGRGWGELMTHPSSMAHQILTFRRSRTKAKSKVKASARGIPT
ncbi:MAG: hypothetical protein Ct9H300mP8_12430 [Gammaproteobacteria bacterium]|nr:MAG: hypothetical protein Ct9H300mP8_12430 [Gammaproteobacteria bacterium]